MIGRNDSLQKFFYYEVCFQEGIVPYHSSYPDTISRSLADLSEEEARKMKRKFRKLWRKARKNLLHNKECAKHAGDADFLAWYYGEVGAPPNREQLARRKNLVAADMRKKANELVKAALNKLVYLHQRMPYNLLVILWVWTDEGKDSSQAI